MWPAAPTVTSRLPQPSANVRARSSVTYGSSVLATTMLGNGSRRAASGRSRWDRRDTMRLRYRSARRAARRGRAPIRGSRPMRHQRARRTVRHEHRVGRGADRGIEPRDPVGAPRAFPIVLHHASERGVGRFPTTLPVFRPRVVESGQDEDRCITHRQLLQFAWTTFACSALGYFTRPCPETPSRRACKHTLRNYKSFILSGGADGLAVPERRTRKLDS